MFLREARDFLNAGAHGGDANSGGANDNDGVASTVIDSPASKNASPDIHIQSLSAVEKIALQVDQVAKSTSVLSVNGMGGAAVSSGVAMTTATTSSLAPPGILPPPGLTLSSTLTTRDGASSNLATAAVPTSSDVIGSNVPPITTTNIKNKSTSILPQAILPKDTTTPSPPSNEKEAKSSSSSSTEPPKIKIRRTQTRLGEQPGKLLANGVAADADATIHPNHNSNTNNNSQQTSSHSKKAPLTVPLRTELTARWILPLKHLRERALRLQKESESNGDTNNNAKMNTPAQNLTIRDALQHLAIGLYRYGCADNGSNCSIVSKEIVSNTNDSNNNGKDYPYDVDTNTDVIFGTVPFYSPRTPGNVVFRMYFENEPHITLATGPMIHVIPTEYSSVLRFVLSNFKSGKNGMSAIHSFGSVLENFRGGQNSVMDEVGRATWGCICETRKLVEGAFKTFEKKRCELNEMERELEEAENVKKELLVMAKGDVVVKKEEGEEKEGMSEERSKLMSERYTNEKKWKEMQLAYATLLEVRLMHFILYYFMT